MWGICPLSNHRLPFIPYQLTCIVAPHRVLVLTNKEALVSILMHIDLRGQSFGCARRLSALTYYELAYAQTSPRGLAGMAELLNERKVIQMMRFELADWCDLLRRG